MNLHADTPTVLFSVETVVRELESKLVLASALAARGCRCIVGHKEPITAIGRASKRVVWQGKGLFSDWSNHHFADELIARDSATMFLHEEGAMHPVNAWTENVLQKHYVDLVRKRDISSVCMWGQRQKDVYVARAAEVAGRVAVTGSPRFDLCQPKYAWMAAGASDGIRARIAPFILACTRFTAIAHTEGLDAPFRRKLNPKMWPESFNMEDVTNLWFTKWHRDVQDFADFVLLIKEIAVHYPQHTIVLRPHPSESLAFYAQAFASFKNVVVTREGGVLAWIRSAEMVVHSNCTTGIEAVLAGRPVLNLLPASATPRETDVEVAREAGLTVGSIEEALKSAGEILAGNVQPHIWSPHAQSMLNNLKTESIPMMVDETLRVIERNGITSSKVSPPKQQRFRNALRRAVKGPAANEAYIASKRGVLDPGHVEMVLDGCRSKHGGGGRIGRLTKEYVVIDPT